MALVNLVYDFEGRVDNALSQLCSGHLSIPVAEAERVRSRLHDISSRVAVTSNALNSKLPVELLVEIMNLALRYNLTHDQRKRLYDAIACTSTAWRALSDDTVPLPVSVQLDATKAICWSLSRLSRSRITKVVWLVWSPGIPRVTRQENPSDIGTIYPLYHLVCSNQNILPILDKAQVSQLSNNLASRKEYLKTVDISSGIELFIGWEKIVTGDLPRLNALRIWNSHAFKTERLDFSANNLHSLHLDHFIPPTSSFPHLQHLILHSISSRYWKYTNFLAFLRLLPDVRLVDLHGQLGPLHEPAQVVSEVAVVVPRLHTLRVHSTSIDGRIMQVFEDLVIPKSAVAVWYPICRFPVALFATLAPAITTVIISSRKPCWFGAALVRKDTLILGKCPKQTGSELQINILRPKRVFLDNLETSYKIRDIENVIDFFTNAPVIHLASPTYGATTMWNPIVQKSLDRGVIIHICTDALSSSIWKSALRDVTTVVKTAFDL
ncbi:hypothetical protein CPB83DRAFT_862646 [Crepidotus variabilis]|uniref:Uncharacterized protein n=1 Tax=Crepidotus variabilis TaxID=179855 RepID=A0A9P6JK50_9AGAR|nr:hypothetical protein CPB83DRAFT_862646 [Crepidotus variabilis]